MAHPEYLLRVLNVLAFNQSDPWVSQACKADDPALLPDDLDGIWRE